MKKTYHVLMGLVAYGLNITDKFDISNDVEWTDVFNASSG